MNELKQKITESLMHDIGRIGKKIDQISNIKTPDELAEFAGDGALGCPSYYGLLHEENKNCAPTMCKQCWLKALDVSLDTADR